MLSLHERRLTICAALALATGLAAGAEQTSPFSLDFSAGTEYDSNVAVLELDSSSGEGDLAALIDLGIGFDTNLSKKLELDLGYDFSQTFYEEFEQFDRRIHRGSGQLSYDFGKVDAGLTYHYADAALDDDDFLVLQRTSPYVSALFGQRFFLRLSYARSDKEFAGSPDRDATTDAWLADSFLFLDGVDRYFTFGYQRRDEDALDDRFDYSGDKLKAQYTRRFAGRRSVKLETGVDFESRSYAADQPLPLLAKPRDDDRYGFRAQLEIGLGERWYFRPRYEYHDNRSNLTDVDFDEHVLSIEIGGKF